MNNQIIHNFQVYILALVNMLYLFQVHTQAASHLLPAGIANSYGSGVTSHQSASGSAHPKPRQAPQVGLVPCPGLVTYPVKFELFKKYFILILFHF